MLHAVVVGGSVVGVVSVPIPVVASASVLHAVVVGGSVVGVVGPL